MFLKKNFKKFQLKNLTMQSISKALCEHLYEALS